jgi:hypothetical protein
MTLDRAHSVAHGRSIQHAAQTWYVVQEEQPDGTFYDACTSFDLDTFYTGISDHNILACYEAGERQE